MAKGYAGSSRSGMSVSSGMPRSPSQSTDNGQGTGGWSPPQVGSNYFALANLAIGKALGVSGRGFLRPSQSISELTKSELRNLYETLNRRYDRSVDPETGNVSYTLTGASLAVTNRNPVTQMRAQRARAICKTIAHGFDLLRSDGCRPFVCADEVRRLIQQAELGLDDMINAIDANAGEHELRFCFERLVLDDPPSSDQVENYLKLTGEVPPERGLISYLVRIASGTFYGISASPDEEEAMLALRDGEEQIKCLQASLVTKRLKAPIAEVRTVVEDCGRCIESAITDIRDYAREVAIGECDLKTVTFQLPNSGLSTNLDILLEWVLREWTAFPKLAELGGVHQLLAIRERAQVVRDTTAALLDPKTIDLESLGLRDQDAEVLTRQLARLRSRASQCSNEIDRALDFPRGSSAIRSPEQEWRHDPPMFHHLDRDRFRDPDRHMSFNAETVASSDSAQAASANPTVATSADAIPAPSPDPVVVTSSDQAPAATSDPVAATNADGVPADSLDQNPAPGSDSVSAINAGPASATGSEPDSTRSAAKRSSRNATKRRRKPPPDSDLEDMP